MTFDHFWTKKLAGQLTFGKVTWMATNLNPLAPQHLPWFLTSPGESDMLYTVTTIFLIVAIVLIGVFFFWLHSLPERMGHKKLQFEVVAVLGLISLFTHMHIFWLIGLLLALVDLPDFMTPLRRIANSAERIAGIEGGGSQESGPRVPPAVAANAKRAEAPNQAKGS
jgi:hypothetical protein